MPDKSYLKMARNFLGSFMPNQTIEKLVEMIQSQIIDYVGYGYTTPNVIINFWLEIILHNSNEWHKNLNVTYILDSIISIAYQFSEVWTNSKLILKKFYPKLMDAKNAKSTGFSLFGSSLNPFEQVVISTDHCWLALMCFEIEHELYEIESGIWPELVNSLSLANNKNALDDTIKNIALRFGLPSLQASSLVVFKIVNYCLSISKEHPLVPIFVELFYHLYLSRVYATQTQTYFDFYGVSSKFYNSNIALFKKFIKWLDEIQLLYKGLAGNEKNEIIRGIQQNIAA